MRVNETCGVLTDIHSFRTSIILRNTSPSRLTPVNCPKAMVLPETIKKRKIMSCGPNNVEFRQPESAAAVVVEDGRTSSTKPVVHWNLKLRESLCQVVV